MTIGKETPRDGRKGWGGEDVLEEFLRSGFMLVQFWSLANVNASL